MRKRKFAAVCAAVMTTGVMTVNSLTVLAQTTPAVPPKTVGQTASQGSTKASDKDMTAAIQSVKSRVKIPDSYSKFSYSTSQSRGMTSYSLSWAHPTSGQSYSATLTGDIITRFTVPNAYQNNGKASIGPFTAENYEKMALDWIYTANPSMKGCLERKGEVYMNISNDVVNITFQRVYKGVKAGGYDNRVDISLDKKTGQVRRMNAGWWQGASFDDPGKVISVNKINEIYSKEVTIKPWYRLTYNSGKKKYEAAIVYEPTESSPEYNALTGEHSTRLEDQRKLQNTDLYSDVTDDSDDIVETEAEAVMESGAGEAPTMTPLTSEEQKAVEELSGMLTAAQFKKKMIADPYMNITDSYLTDNFRIYKDENAECGYTITCTFKIDNKTAQRECTVTADAKSGKVESFYAYGWDGHESSDVISPSKAAKLGTEAARYYYGDIMDGYKADTENSAPAAPEEIERTIRFYRYVNGIQVDGDVIRVTVNSGGQVMSVSKNHTVNVDFGDGKVISKETAFKMLFEQQSPELSFMGFTDLKSVPHTYLTYQMPSWHINAKTGKLCQWNGKPIDEKETVPEVCPYTDIAASPCKSEIETLYNYGIRVYTGDKFDPTAKITSRELENMWNAVLGYGISYSYYEDGVEVEEEMSYEEMTAGGITNREFAKRMVAKLRAEEYAKLKGIYKSPFTDVSDSDPDIGYIAIAYAMGGVSGVNGKFSPDAYVTREYAMHCFYNYIKSQS